MTLVLWKPSPSPSSGKFGSRKLQLEANCLQGVRTLDFVTKAQPRGVMEAESQPPRVKIVSFEQRLVQIGSGNQAHGVTVKLTEWSWGTLMQRPDLWQTQTQPPGQLKWSQLTPGQRYHERQEVFYGQKTKTSAGLMRENLVKNKKGAIVPWGKHCSAKKSPWMVAVGKARVALNIKGFVLMQRGTPLHQKATEFMTKFV